MKRTTHARSVIFARDGGTYYLWWTPSTGEWEIEPSDEYEPMLVVKINGEYL